MRKRWWLAAFPLVAACCALAAPAQDGHGDAAQAESAEQHADGEQAAGGSGGDEHAAAEAHGETAPLLSFDPGSAVWTIVVFVLLVVVLRAAAWKPILSALQGREEFIRKSIEDAKTERLEADKLLVQYKEQIDKAREEATAIVEEGRRDAEEVRKRLQQEARKEADETIARGKREIELASANAIKDIYDRTANLAVEVAGRIVEKTLSPEDHQGLVAESLERMKASNN